MQMKLKLFIFTLVASGLFASYFYQMDTPALTQSDSLPVLSLKSDLINDLSSKINVLSEHDADTAGSLVTLRPEAAKPVSDTSSTAQRYLNIHGTIDDEYDRPIENALISEEFRFHSTRSDANGRYQISVKLATFKNPVVNILRAGYREERVWIEGDDLQDGQSVKIDVSLAEAFDTTSIHGWIGNQNGESRRGE